MTEKEMLVAQVLNIGGFVEKIDFHEFAPGFRGIVATEDIAESSIVMFIPEEFLIQKKYTVETPTW